MGIPQHDCSIVAAEDSHHTKEKEKKRREGKRAAYIA
jgi:hypothetical protein